MMTSRDRNKTRRQSLLPFGSSVFLFSEIFETGYFHLEKKIVAARLGEQESE